MFFKLFRVSSEENSHRLRGSVPHAAPGRPSPGAGGGASGDKDPVAGLVFMQVASTAVGVGIWANSWWVGGAALLGLFWLFDRPRVALVLGVGYSLLLGSMAGGFVFMLAERRDAGIVSAIVAFVFLLSLNLEHVRRISR